MLVTAINPVALEGRKLALPLVAAAVPAGFPSPADDYLDGTLDLNEHLIRHPAATYLVYARGESMFAAGIRDNALLIVDCSATAKDGDTVIATVEGRNTVKYLRKRDGVYWLEAASGSYKPIKLCDEDSIFGVVLYSINSHR
ncbi:translesion error-prone DNA polymerase V autoproteolytic subunit [Oleiharenicola lentus]|uniref:translesion error-prone DNA polymerase V autoproteolytic subunit n=1 Tax=Oleiharenicola lentus TaxID=2508720 RepID=UPI003F661C64